MRALPSAVAGEPVYVTRSLHGRDVDVLADEPHFFEQPGGYDAGYWFSCHKCFWLKLPFDPPRDRPAPGRGLPL